jgi:hypothetical protein
MSIHREGRKWRVKYRIAGKQRSRMFDRKGDARPSMPKSPVVDSSDHGWRQSSTASH